MDERDTQNFSSSFIDIRQLTPEDETRLRREIEDVAGQAWFIIHPFYDSDLILRGSDTEEIEKYIKYTTLVRNILHSPKHIIFIFEEKEAINSTKTKLQTFGVNTPICFVPTDMANPTPCISSDKLNNSMRVKREWQYLTQKMFELGVRKIFLGGSLYGFDHRGRPEGCVAIANKQLVKRGFQTILTHACYPDSHPNSLIPSIYMELPPKMSGSSVRPNSDPI